MMTSSPRGTNLLSNAPVILPHVPARLQRSAELLLHSSPLERMAMAHHGQSHLLQTPTKIVLRLLPLPYGRGQLSGKERQLLLRKRQMYWDPRRHKNSEPRRLLQVMLSILMRPRRRQKKRQSELRSWAMIQKQKKQNRKRKQRPPPTPSRPRR